MNAKIWIALESAHVSLCRRKCETSSLRKAETKSKSGQCNSVFSPGDDGCVSTLSARASGVGKDQADDKDGQVGDPSEGVESCMYASRLTSKVDINQR
jgi:hypothetical protein